MGQGLVLDVSFSLHKIIPVELSVTLYQVIFFGSADVIVIGVSRASFSELAHASLPRSIQEIRWYTYFFAMIAPIIENTVCRLVASRLGRSEAKLSGG